MSIQSVIDSDLLLAEAVERCWPDINSVAVVGGKHLSQLMAACYGGNPDRVCEILQVPGVKIELQNKDGWHALMWASRQGHTEIVRLVLLACNRPQEVVNQSSYDGVTSLMLASGSGHMETALVLLENGANVNAQNHIGAHSLLIASVKGHQHIVSLLLQYNADIESQNKYGVSSLIAACFRRHKEIVVVLLEAGARVNLNNSSFHSRKNPPRSREEALHGGVPLDVAAAVDIAVAQGCPEIVSLLLQHGGEVFDIYEVIKHIARKQKLMEWSGIMQKRCLVMFKLLFSHNRSLISQLNSCDPCILYFLSCDGAIELVSFLLKRRLGIRGLYRSGFDSRSCWCHLIFSHIYSSPPTRWRAILELLVRNGLDINYREKTPFSRVAKKLFNAAKKTRKSFSAAQKTSFSKVAKKSFSAADVAVCMNSEFALGIASSKGRVELAKCLVQCGADIDQQTSQGLSCLIMASNRGHTSICSFLLRSNANVDLQDNNGYSALMHAVLHGRFETVQCLLQGHAQVNLIANDGSTALILCCTGTVFGLDLDLATTIAKGLIAYEADVTVLNKKEDSALTLATQLNMVFMVQLIVDTNCDKKFLNHWNRRGNSSLMIASSCGYIEILGILLRAGADVNISSFFGQRSLRSQPDSIKISFPKSGTIRGSALDNAVLYGYLGIIRLLLQYGARIHNVYYLFRNVILKLAHKTRLDRSAQTNFSNDLWEKYHAIFQLLFSHDSDLMDRVQCTKPSLLYLACAFGVTDIVSFLLEACIDVGDFYRVGDNRLSYWCSLVKIISSKSMLSSVRTNRDIIDFLSEMDWMKYMPWLIAKGLDVNHQDHDSGTFALGIACGEGHIRLVQYLLHSGANVNSQDKEGVSGLMEASAGGHFEVCKLLLGHRGVVVDLKDKQGWSALMFAVAGGYIEIVAYLLRSGAQVNLQDKCNTSSLMLSCFTGDVYITKLLLAHNADVYLQNNEGISALMMCSYNGHTEIAKTLLKHSRDCLSMVTCVGKTALDFAKDQAMSTLLGGKLGRGKRAALDNPMASTARAVRSFHDHSLPVEIDDKLQEILEAFLPASGEQSQSVYYDPSDKPELKDAFNLIRDFAYNWEGIGVFLKIPNSTLDEIKYDCCGTSKDCLMRLLEVWICRFHATWAKLREAIELATYNLDEIPLKRSRLDTSFSATVHGDGFSLGDAFDRYRDFAHCWENIGHYLKVSRFTIEEIKYDCDGRAGRCFYKLLEKWLVHVSPHPTWSELSEAVQKASENA